MGARPIDQEGSDPPERALPVEHGQVMCPRRGAVDIERCWACREYRGMADAHVEWLVCALTDDDIASGFWAIEQDRSRSPGGGHA
ncbi:MAG: hypothetical protein ACJ77D_12525 [Chloroflexota bacterium]|jgi:hypothetical protein